MLSTAIDTRAAIGWYRRNRRRSEALFDLIDPAAYYSRPIALRNPIVFYEGHLPAFSVIAFLRRGLGRPAVASPLDARVECEASAVRASRRVWRRSPSAASIRRPKRRPARAAARRRYGGRATRSAP